MTRSSGRLFGWRQGGWGAGFGRQYGYGGPYGFPGGMGPGGFGGFGQRYPMGGGYGPHFPMGGGYGGFGGPHCGGYGRRW